jgi:hypothetical protein
MPPGRPRLRTLAARACAVLAATPVLFVPLVAAPAAPAGAAAAPPAVPTRTTVVPLSGVDAGALPAAAGWRAPRGAAPRPFALTGERSTARFATIGVTWEREAGTAPVAVAVRVRTAGKWSGWQELETTTESPDPQDLARMPRAKAGTSPLFVGVSDGVQAQARLTGPGKGPRNAAVQLVDPGSSPADSAVRPAAPRAAAAAGGVPMPRIISRAEWGADESLAGRPRYASTVHHTASSNGYYTQAEAMQQLRGIYRYHTVSLGWSDIAYPFLVDRFGNIYEGHGGGVDTAVIGGHTYGFNTGNTAISLLGNFEPGEPGYVPASSAMMNSTARLAAWKLSRYGRDPNGWSTITSSSGTNSHCRSGTLTVRTISGHRDPCFTACPGASAYDQLPTVRSLAAATFGVRFSAPSITPEPGAVRVRAGAAGITNWKVSVTTQAGAPVASWSGGATNEINTSWNLKDAAGLVSPGMYYLRLTGGDGRVEAEPVLTGVRISADGGARPVWPVGTFLSGAGKSWLVDETASGELVRRPVLSAVARLSYPRATERLIPVSDAVLATLPTGPPLVHREGALLRTDSGELHVIHRGQRHEVSEAKRAELNYDPAKAWRVSDAELAAVPAGAAWTAATHANGQLFHDTAGNAWVVRARADGSLVRQGVGTAVGAFSQLTPEAVVGRGTAADRALPVDGWVLGIADGWTYRDGDGRSYVVSRGQARQVSASAVAALGLRDFQGDLGPYVGHPRGSAPLAATSGIDWQLAQVRLVTMTDGVLEPEVSWRMWMPGTPAGAAPAANPRRQLGAG